LLTALAGASVSGKQSKPCVITNARRGEQFTYQNWGKLSLSSSHQRSSSHSRSLSLGLLPNFCATLSVVLLVIGAGLEALLYFAESSDRVTAFRTSVIDVLAEACPDLRRWWCMERGLDLVAAARILELGERGDDRRSGVRHTD
jgi:hypothetical protein